MLSVAFYCLLGLTISALPTCPDHSERLGKHCACDDGYICSGEICLKGHREGQQITGFAAECSNCFCRLDPETAVQSQAEVSRISRKDPGEDAGSIAHSTLLKLVSNSLGKARSFVYLKLHKVREPS